MNHIKLYENFNKLYTQIDSIEFAKLITKLVDRNPWYPFSVNATFEEFTNYQKSIIKKIFISNISFESSLIIIEKNNNKFEILKAIDEIYIVIHNEIYYYTCDQFDGLLECINNIYKRETS